MLNKCRLFSSFGYAIKGVSDAFKSEPNLKIHFVISLAVIAIGIFLNISTYEWAVLVLTIFLVITLELVNTAIEKMVDIISPQINEKARLAKDISAAVVLMGAIASVAVGALIFLPKIFQ